MDEYSWPPDGERAADRWGETVAALPDGVAVTGQVIGRQPFGVFVEIDGVSGAVGLAEVTTMSPGAVLPAVGTTVQGTVIDHTTHNHQVRLRLLNL